MFYRVRNDWILSNGVIERRHSSCWLLWLWLSPCIDVFCLGDIDVDCLFMTHESCGLFLSVNNIPTYLSIHFTMKWIKLTCLHTIT